MRTLLCIVLCLTCACSAHRLSAAERQTGTAEGSIVITLRGSLPLMAQANFLAPMDRVQTRHGANELLRKALRAAEQTIVLDLSSGFMPSIAAAEELADTIRRNRGEKKIICLLENISDPVSVIAAVADEVVVADAGLLYLSGLSFNIDHYTGMLAKFGVRFEAITSGLQKTAPEPLTKEQPSAAALSEYQALLTAIDASLVGLSIRPDFSEEQLRSLRAKAPQTAAIAVAEGFADKVVEPGAFILSLPQPQRDMTGAGPAPDLESFAGIMSWWSQMMAGPTEPKHRQMVAVVQLEGTIVDGDGALDSGMISAEASVRLLEKIGRDDRIKAVVLRINSGGGSAGASDRIYHAVRRLDAQKPVVALFDDAAASGGYYIGIGARKIVSHHSTITGSIGVFALMPDLSGVRDLLGIHRTTLNSDPRSDMFTTNAMTDERRAGLKHLVMAMDVRFQGLVAERRGLDATTVTGLASGRVYTGEQALANGLVDALGTLPDAVLAARTAAGIEQALPLRIYPQPGGIAAMLGLGPMAAAPSWMRALVSAQHLPKVWSWHYLPDIR